MRFWRDVGEAMTEAYRQQKMWDIKGFWPGWTVSPTGRVLLLPAHPMIYR